MLVLTIQSALPAISPWLASNSTRYGPLCARAGRAAADLLGEAEDVLAGPAAGAWQLARHATKMRNKISLVQLELQRDGRVDDGGRLQAVAQRLVVELQGPRRMEGAAGLVPVVDEVRDASHGPLDYAARRVCRRPRTTASRLLVAGAA